MYKGLLQKFVIAGMVIILSACNLSDGDNNSTPNSTSTSAPVAEAGSDQTDNILVGDVVQLDGSASSDADADALSYAWSFKTIPDGSSAALSDPAIDKPVFIVDIAGTYIAELVVGDGSLTSDPNQVTVIVVVAAPTVTITAPPPQTLVTSSPVTVIGTVDDPLAMITVNGIATPNNNGDYSADVTLREGSNTVTVLATNSTGQSQDSITIILKTLPDPVMSISSHSDGFIEGLVWDRCPPSEPSVIPVQVRGTISTQLGPPIVMVNGVAAVVSALPSNPLLVKFCDRFPNVNICSGLNISRYSFSVDLDLSVGQHTIMATGFDTAGGSISVAVNGVADFCYIVEESVSGHCASTGNNPAIRGNNQSKACHAIDGCSVYLEELGGPILGLNNNPMPLAVTKRVPIEFGDGNFPPTEFFVHGEFPQRLLGCNIHDTCYQTCVPAGQEDQERSACNEEQYVNHKEKCREAYPQVCPFTITGLLGNTFPDPLKCLLWLQEKHRCFISAFVYFSGVTLRGKGAYDERQAQYCHIPK